jgi:hypothetical protein
LWYRFQNPSRSVVSFKAITDKGQTPCRFYTSLVGVQESKQRKVSVWTDGADAFLFPIYLYMQLNHYLFTSNQCSDKYYFCLNDRCQAVWKKQHITTTLQADKPRIWRRLRASNYCSHIILKRLANCATTCLCTLSSICASLCSMRAQRSAPPILVIYIYTMKYNTTRTS